MFIFTAKFNKRKAIAAVLVLAAVLVAIVLIAGNANNSNAKETAALSAVVKNNEQRVNYLKALGWEVEQNVLEQQKIVIPRKFTDVYKKYNEIQLAQGFDLSKFGGVEAMRYTYKVLNYPEATATVVADIIVFKNEVIAGDIQSNALDGFMAGLAFPKKDAPQPSASDTMAADDQTGEAAVNPDAAGDTAEGASTQETSGQDAAAETLTDADSQQAGEMAP
jgi:hypothetical protein